MKQPMNNQEMPEEESMGMQEEASQESVGPEITPQEQKEVEAYTAGLAKLLHSKETRKDIHQMLKSAPPEKSVPYTALEVNKMMESKARQSGKDPSLTVLLNACIYLVSDLVEIGNAGGFFEVTDEKQFQGLLKDTMQEYIVQGVKAGTLDPVEVQAAAEQYMSPEDREMAMSAGEGAGVPRTAGNMQAMESYGRRREMDAVKKTEQKFKNKQETSALMQNAMPQQQQQQGGK